VWWRVFCVEKEGSFSIEYFMIFIREIYGSGEKISVVQVSLLVRKKRRKRDRK
jgi:hypothetical protein